MKALISEYVQLLLADVAYESRSGRRLIVLVGMLGESGIPEEISKETSKLARLLVLKDMFSALIEPISSLSKRKERLLIEHQGDAKDTSYEQLILQIDETRKLIADLESVNYPLLISWIIKETKARKLLTFR